MASKVIWIGQNLDGIKTSQYIDNINSNNSSKIKTFEIIDKALDYLKDINFEDIKVIVTDKLYNDFVNGFKEKILSMNIAPKLIVFTKDKEKFKLENPQYENKDTINNLNINQLHKNTFKLPSKETIMIKIKIFEEELEQK